MARNKIAICPHNLKWLDDFKINDFWSGLYFHPNHPKITSENFSLYPSVFRAQTLATFWDEKSFAILSRDPEEVKLLSKLFFDFKKHNISLIFSPNLGVLAKYSLLVLRTEQAVEMIREKYDAEK